MRSTFLHLVRAEITLLTKRAATWIILGIWVVVATIFAYILPYASYRTGTTNFAESFESILPSALAQTIGQGFPFYGGALALILGVLSIGSEYGWNTWKTLLTQGPGRTRVFGAKMAALGVMLVPFVLAAFLMGAIASSSIAMVEDVAITWPTFSTLVESIVSGWLILAVWASAGVLLATVTRGTSLAIGIGILWGLAFEGLLSAFATSVSWLEWIVDIMIRANGYSLLRAIGGDAPLDADGPGAFAGPYVSGTQAIIMLSVYLVVFLAGSAWFLHRRDVT